MPRIDEPKKKKLVVYTKPSARKGGRTKKAVNRLNKEVGTTVVRTTKNRKAADVVVSTLPKKAWAAGLSYDYFGPKKMNKVKIKKNTHPQTVEHELGHQLGLEHRPPRSRAIREVSGGHPIRTDRGTATSGWHNLMNVTGGWGNQGQLTPGQKKTVVKNVSKSKRKK